MSPLLRAADWLRHKARLKQWTPAQAQGRRGEDLAHRYLRKLGYTVIARNFRVRSSGVELDLVALDGEIVVFVEVKTRGSVEFGLPEDAVDHEKRLHLQRAANSYLHKARLSASKARFDIVSVVCGATEEVTHIKDAFFLGR